VPVQAVVTVSGSPLTPEPASEQGFKLERSYHHLDGSDADPTQAKQNDRLVVVLKVTEPQPQFARVALGDYIPAGFEIDNPHLVSSGDVGTLSWITDVGTPVHTEFRDDRFTAAFDRASGDAPVYSVRLYRPRGVAGRVCAAASQHRRHVSARSLRPHRDRDGEREVRKMNEELAANSAAGDGEIAVSEPPHSGPLPIGERKKRSWKRLAIYTCVGLIWFTAIIAGGIAGLIDVFGPSPLGKTIELSTIVIDRNGKLLRPYVTSNGRWRLPATRESVDPRYLDMLLAYEDKRFWHHRGVDPLR